jgi:hypothetical protein
LAERIVFNEQDLTLSSILTSSSNLRSNREVEGGFELNSEKLLKIEDIEELVSIIAELNQKIDDVIIDINDFEKYKKEKEVLQQENKFTTDYDKTKVVDATSLGIVRKRQRKDENVDVNEKEEGGKRVKKEEEKADPIVPTSTTTTIVDSSSTNANANN